MDSQSTFNLRSWVNDFRAGLSEIQIMEKYGLSVRQFSALLVQAFRMGILKESEINRPDGCRWSNIKLKDPRRYCRKKVDCRLLVREVKHPRNHGTAIDICEEGLQVAGLPAEPGERVDLEILTDWDDNHPAVVVEAACRWSNSGVAAGEGKSGFQTIRVIQGDLLGLLEDISPLSLVCTKLSDLTDSSDADEDACDLEVTGGARTDLKGPRVPTEVGISQLRFFRLLDTLPIPCLLVNQAGRIIHVNRYSYRISPAMFTLKNNQFSSMFGEEAAIWKEGARSRIPVSGRGYAEATLRIEGAPLPCQLQFNFLRSDRGPLILVFFQPSAEQAARESPHDPEEIPDHAPLFGAVRPTPNESSARTDLRDRTADMPESQSNGVFETNQETVRMCIDRVVESYEYPRSKAMGDVLETCRLAAKSDSVVLLLGESGCGKDYLAHYIHNLSPRSNAAFSTVNCAAIPEHLAESEIFGHEEGAFTGAQTERKGILELAQGGSTMLNEIGELPPVLQAKLLTFLDSGSFFRVGGRSEVSIDSRILAATNRDLRKEVEKGRFRADLFFRLNVFPIRIPPLRERIEDIPVLIAKLGMDLVKRLRSDTVPTVTTRTLNVLQKYHWPGNVRELQNRLERSLVLSGGKTISLALMFSPRNREIWTFNLHFPAGSDLNHFKKEALRSLITEALVRAGGKRQLAAELLGITRYALKRHMTNLGLLGNENDIRR